MRCQHYRKGWRGLNAAPGEGKVRSPWQSQSETDQLSQNFITINNTTVPNTRKETVAGALIIATVLLRIVLSSGI
jgi:hypothetical protein